MDKQESGKKGRKEIPKENKVARLPLYAQSRVHTAIVEKFKEPIERFEKKTIKELDQ
jgi:hypothetical protein